MKFRAPALALMMLISMFSFAASKHPPQVGVGGQPAQSDGDDPVSGFHTPKRSKKQFVIGAITSSAACGLAIGLSANPATAAEIGVPILVGGNYLAYRLYQNHPRWSAVVQTLSPLGCALGGLHKPAKPPVKLSDPHTPINNPGSNPPSGGGNPSGNPGGNPGGSGGSTGSGSGSGGSNGGGGSTGGSGGSTGGGNPPPAPCTVHGGTDCGFGNGGFNGGSNPKPPTTPPGDPHTHGKL